LVYSSPPSTLSVRPPDDFELEALLNEARDKNLRTVSQLSSWHDNGFGKLVLVGREDGSAVRVHVWKNDTNEWSPETNIHSHRADFASKMLCGQMRMRTYEKRAGDDFREYEYRSLKRGQEYSLRHRGASSVDVMLEFNAGEGFSYALHHQALHSVATKGPIVVTAVVTAPTQSLTTTVLTNRYEEQDQQGGFRRMNELECKDLIEQVYKLIMG
jgi:hypothetical protein